MDVVPNGSTEHPSTVATVLVGRRNGGVDVVRVDRVTGALDEANVIRWKRDEKVCSAISSIHSVVVDGQMAVCTLLESGEVWFYDANMEGTIGKFTCPPNVTCAAYHPASNQLAVGFQGAELKVYKIEKRADESDRRTEEADVTAMAKAASGITGRLTYSAKGGKPDKVGICDKPWNSAMAFNTLAEDGSQIIVATGYGKLRLYDTTVGKRPQLNKPFKEQRIMTVAVRGDENVWWVGDAGGNLQSFDVTTGTFMGAIKGIAGSVRSIALHPTAKTIASGGLDRYVRIHSTRTRKSVAKIYVTSQVNAVRWIGGVTVAEEKKKTSKKRKVASS